MKITVNEDRLIQIEECFTGICLKSVDGELFHITMRDGAFEFVYGDDWYYAKDGVIGKFRKLNNVSDSDSNNLNEPNL